MAKIISLDCDGVIADVEGFFKSYFFDYFGREASPGFIQSCYGNRIKEYSEKENLDYNSIMEFLKAYEKNLFLSLPELRIMEGAGEGIENIKEKGIEVIVNSYRPSEFKGMKQDTQKITQEWFEKNGVYVPLHLAESKDEKCSNINSGDYSCHVDDDINILGKLGRKLKPVLFNKSYKPDSKFLHFDSWPELSDFLIEEKNVFL